MKRTALVRHVGIVRRSRLRRMSATAQKFAAQFEQAKVIVASRSQGFCEAQTSACSGFGQHFHHRAGRVGPGVNLPGMILHVCWRCHRYLHTHPLESYERGWLVRRLGRAA